MMGLRPFLVLDEADCWLSPQRVSDFARVISRLSHDLGLQVLIISHHETSLFHGFPVHLERVDGETEEGKDPHPSVKVRYVPDNMDRQAAGMKSPEGYSPLKSISIKNFMSHKDTVIPLSPGVTVLTGDNDVGKSVVTEAIRAVAYNSASDAMIRHGAKKAEVTIEMMDGSAIQWVRVQQGNPKVLYRWMQGGAIEQESPAGRDMPEWVTKRMGIGMQEDMDVQIGDQKSPVFLLNETPSKRAAILDIGQESRYLRALRERWKLQMQEDRKSIRDGENRLRFVEKLLEQTKSLPALLVSVDRLKQDAPLLSRRIAKLESGEASCSRAEAAQRRMRVWESHKVASPLLASVEKMKRDAPLLSRRMATLETGTAFCSRAEMAGQRMRVWESHKVELPGKLNRQPDLERLSRAGRYMPSVTALEARLRIYRGAPDSTTLPDIRSATIKTRLDKMSDAIHVGRNVQRTERRMRAWSTTVRPEIIMDLTQREARIAEGLNHVSTAVDRGRAMATAAQQVTVSSESAQATRKALAAMEQEKSALMNGVEACPLCGNALSGGSAHFHPKRGDMHAQ
jgi:DNA repair exonuclease SbcCD ATPase subunit